VSSGSRDEQLVLQQQQLSRQRTKMKTTTIISTDGAMVVSHPEPAFADKVIEKGLLGTVLEKL
jgi:hypothetical protein